MKVTLESTTKIVDIETATGIVPGRIWEGRTESGIYVQAIITRIACPDEANRGQFEAELTVQRAPHRPDVYPNRLVL